MGKLRDLTGKTFGKLYVIKRAYNIKQHIYWKCSCECGTIKDVNSTNLLAGKVKSCGCIKKPGNTKKGFDRPNTMEYGEGSLSYLINRYRQTAKKRALEYNLTREQFRELTKGNCSYCGDPPSLEVKGHRSNGEYIFNGIDRVDSNKGYLYENCVSCCEFCNKAKLDHSKDDFLNWIVKVYMFQSNLTKK